MDKKKKRAVFIGGVAAVFFTVPLIVFAITYKSVDRDNRFQPAEANIQVKEGAERGDELIKNDYVWTSDGDNYVVSKPVQIYDERKKNDEYLRVRFIPMWYDDDGNVCGGADEFSDFSSVGLDNADPAQASALLFKNSAGAELLSLELCTDPRWDESWEYNESDQCFYYKGPIGSGDISATLLSGAKISKAAYDASADLTLHVEALADAIQTSGNARTDRWDN